MGNVFSIIALIPATKSHQGWRYQRVYWRKIATALAFRAAAPEGVID
jgi:hypothetical protein